MQPFDPYLKKQLENEKMLSTKMIGLFCRKHHRQENSLCPDCKDLSLYAGIKLDSCAYLLTAVKKNKAESGKKLKKISCLNCPVHCYRDDYRLKIKKVMRFAGPKILFYHPVLLLKHLFKI